MDAHGAVRGQHGNLDVLQRDGAKKDFSDLEFRRHVERTNQVGRDFDGHGFRRCVGGNVFSRRHVPVEVDIVCRDRDTVLAIGTSRHLHQAFHRGVVQREHEVAQHDGLFADIGTGSKRYLRKRGRIRRRRRLDIELLHQLTRRELFDFDRRLRLDAASIRERFDVGRDSDVGQVQVEAARCHNLFFRVELEVRRREPQDRRLTRNAFDVDCDLRVRERHIARVGIERGHRLELYVAPHISRLRIEA